MQKTSDKRWHRAITRAVEEIETTPYMEWKGGELLVLSSTSNEIYTANGVCQCKAYKFNQLCWHRAAARLVQRYNETTH